MPAECCTGAFLQLHRTNTSFHQTSLTHRSATNPARCAALMKQARAFGAGVVIATQNPMDWDYRALSNVGLWCVGRLQADADRARMLEVLAGGAGAGQCPGRSLKVLHQEIQQSITDVNLDWVDGCATRAQCRAR
jgi:hypothetical protein